MRRLAIFLASLLYAGALLAQTSPAQVTDAQIKQYKADAEKGCLDAGKAQGDMPEQVAKFCKCISTVFDKHLSREEWQRAYFNSKQGRAAEERNVFGPHEAKIRECKAG